MEKEVQGLVVPLYVRTYDDCHFNNKGDRDCKSTHCQQKQNLGLCSNYVWWEGSMPRWQPQMRARWPTRPGQGCNEIWEDARKWLKHKTDWKDWEVEQIPVVAEAWWELATGAEGVAWATWSTRTRRRTGPCSRWSWREKHKSLSDGHKFYPYQLMSWFLWDLALSGMM